MPQTRPRTLTQERLCPHILDDWGVNPVEENDIKRFHGLLAPHLASLERGLYLELWNGAKIIRHHTPHKHGHAC